MPTWITVARFRDLSSGLVARSALEAAGIPCLLRDENTVRLDWQISNFIGGMRLQVMEQDAAAAEAVLSVDVDGESELSLEAAERCPYCGSGDVHRGRGRIGLQVAFLWLFSLPLPGGRTRWQCSHCGRDFPESELVEM